MAHNMGFWYQQGVCLLEVFVYLCLSIREVCVNFLCMCICILLLVYPQGVCGFLMHVYLGLSLKHNMFPYEVFGLCIYLCICACLSPRVEVYAA